MPGVAFPSWWVVSDDIIEVYSKYNMIRPSWDKIKSTINSKFGNIDNTFLSRYCSQFRGDPVLLSYSGLVKGILEKTEDDPLLLFPSVALSSLDEDEYSEKSSDLLEMLESAEDGEFSFLNDCSNWFKPHSEFSVNNFHPMLAEGVGCAIGTLLTRYVAAELSSDDVLDLCCYGDKLYAKGLGDWANEIADYYDRVSEDLLELLTSGSVDELPPSFDRVVSPEILEILSGSLNELADLLEKKGKVRISRGLYLINEGGSNECHHVKTRSEMNSKKLLSSAISRLRRL